MVLALLGGWAGAAMGAPSVPRLVAEQVMTVDSIRSQTLQLLARGQVSEAIDYWVLATGKEAPAWLLAAKTAFEASKQVAGACQGVAQSLYTAFSRLGGKPELVELRNVAANRFPYISFRMPNGQDMKLTETGYHVLVRMNGRAYDAFTGAAGMPWADYLRCLGSRSEITQKVVEVVTEAP